jgi:hypothetical protein
MKWQVYHVEEPHDIKYTGINMGATGFKTQRGEKNNGLGAMYNIQDDYHLGPGAR